MGRMQIKYFNVIALLLITSVLSWRLIGSQPQSYDIRLKDFPLTIGSWQGKSLEVDNPELVYAVLETKTVLNRVYANSKAKNEIVDLFITYSERTSRGFHPPEVSFVAGGQTIIKKGIEYIPLGKEKDSPKLEANMFLGKTSGEGRVLFLYWFGIGERLMANYYKSSQYLLWDTIRGKNSPASMVRVAIPLVDDDVNKTMAVATDFIQQIVPLIPEYLKAQKH